MNIRQLPKEVYDLIAAGEVVLAPVSVVKELAENSLDAGAGRVTVDIKNGGIDRIRVADNGSGIAREDLELAFAPHATSKLSCAEDLWHIETLGFRGEALASVAAVSNIVMVTKTDGETVGSRAEAGGDRAVQIAPAGTDSGTDVVVEQLFFNIPARKKHLSNPRVEERAVIEYLSKAAVSRPDVSFRLISDNKPVFTTTGSGDRLSAIASVYGSQTAQNLIPVSAESREYRLEGYISGALGLRGNRKGQHIFVNGRPVKNAAIEAAIGRAYREFAEPGRFPVVFLFITADPSVIDVNVHPAKSEISFQDPGKIEDFVQNSMLSTLNSEQSIPRLRAPYRDPSDTVFRLEEKTYGDTEEGKTMFATSGGNGEKVNAVDINNLLSSDKIDDNVNIGDNNQYIKSLEMIDDNIFQLFNEETDDHYEKSLIIHELTPLTTLFATYILGTYGNSVYIIDQHAAHERVNFERFRDAYKQGEIVKQGLMTPYLFTPPAAVKDLTPFIVFFDKLGYELDEFGENTWAARTYPAFIPAGEAEGFLLESIESLGNELDVKTRDISFQAAERIIMRACKASVKANKAVSDEEIKALIDALSKCKNPYTCPHGRPVFVKLTLSDIERLFKRA